MFSLHPYVFKTTLFSYDILGESEKKTDKPLVFTGHLGEVSGSIVATRNFGQDSISIKANNVTPTSNTTHTLSKTSSTTNLSFSLSYSLPKDTSLPMLNSQKLCQNANYSFLTFNLNSSLTFQAENGSRMSHALQSSILMHMAELKKQKYTLQFEAPNMQQYLRINPNVLCSFSDLEIKGLDEPALKISANISQELLLDTKYNLPSLNISTGTKIMDKYPLKIEGSWNLNTNKGKISLEISFPWPD